MIFRNAITKLIGKAVPRKFSAILVAQTTSLQGELPRNIFRGTPKKKKRRNEKMRRVHEPMGDWNSSLAIRASYWQDEYGKWFKRSVRDIGFSVNFFIRVKLKLKLVAKSIFSNMQHPRENNCKKWNIERGLNPTQVTMTY